MSQYPKLFVLILPPIELMFKTLIIFTGQSDDNATDQQYQRVLREPSQQRDNTSGTREDTWRRNSEHGARARRASTSRPGRQTRSRQLRLLSDETPDPLLAGRLLSR